MNDLHWADLMHQRMFSSLIIPSEGTCHSSQLRICHGSQKQDFASLWEQGVITPSHQELSCLIRSHQKSVFWPKSCEPDPNLYLTTQLFSLHLYVDSPEMNVQCSPPSALVPHLILWPGTLHCFSLWNSIGKTLWSKSTDTGWLLWSHLWYFPNCTHIE